MSRCRGVLVAAALVMAGCGGDDGRPSVTANAASPYADSPVKVDVRGLEAHERATLEARWTSLGGHVWASRVPLRADGDGAVRLRGFEGMRFLWGMRPPASLKGEESFFPPPRGTSSVALSVVAGPKTVARTLLSRRITPGSVRMRKLTPRRDGVSGYLFTPATGTRRPAALVFGGSEGGNRMVDAAGLLAAHGYPALALAYFKEPGLPKHLVDVPLEYFERGLRILRRQPVVDPGRVVTLGVSRGGEASLLVASTFPKLVHGAIGLVPSASVNLGLGGRPNAAAWTYRDKPIYPRAIAVERIDGPILTAGGGDDLVWNSTGFTEAIERRLEDKRFRFPHRALNYQAAGHLVGAAMPYLPHTRRLERHGGTLRADAAARADLWPRILAYFSALARAGRAG
jgi:dienelactone hydrolase